MLKKMLIILGMIGLCSQAAFAAEELSYTVTDFGSGRISVSGSVSQPITDSFVGVTIFKPGADIENIPSLIQNNSYIQYHTQTRLLDKAYSVSLKLEPLQSDEPYMLAASVNGVRYTLPVYYFSEADIDAYISELNALEPDGMSKEELGQVCDKMIEIFSANSSEIYSNYYDSLDDKAEIASIFLKSANKSLAKDSGYKSIKDLIDSSIVCAAYNHGLTEGKLVYGELLGFDKDTYSSGLCKSGMTEAGIKFMVGLMKGNENIADLQKSFAKQSILAAVSYPVNYGYGHITDILSNNSAVTILSEYGFDKNTYNNSNKTEVAKIVFNNSDDSIKSDIKAFVEYVNKISKENPKPTDNGGGGGGGGGSSSGKGSNTSPSVTLPIVNTNQTEVEYEDVFNDLEGAQWAKRAIMALYKSGAISGIDSNTFAPFENITREQFVKILVCAMNIEPSDEELAFGDTDKNMWYYPYVAAAVKNGIVFGISEDTFGVGEYITREQIAAMCSRVIDRTSDAVVSDFADNSEISEYAHDSVMLMKRLGIINGNELGEFKPKSYATRAEVAQIVYGIVNL